MSKIYLTKWEGDKLGILHQVHVSDYVTEKSDSLLLICLEVTGLSLPTDNDWKVLDLLWTQNPWLSSPKEPHIRGDEEVHAIKLLHCWLVVANDFFWLNPLGPGNLTCPELLLFLFIFLTLLKQVYFNSTEEY